MGRVLITIIVPLLLPTAVYVVWRLIIGRGTNFSATWIWLAAGGLALAALTLIAVSIDFGAPSQGVYVPPHRDESGAVVPGHMQPQPPQGAR